MKSVSMPVSYTHLDVYKRQAFELRHIDETAFRSEGFDLLVEKGVQ